MLRLKPIILIEKSDISAVGEEDGSAVDAVPVESIPARVER